MSPVQSTNTKTAPADALNDAFSQWKRTVEAELKGASFDKKLMTRTFEGVALQPLYTRADVAAIPGVGQVPGQAPYLRGTRALGYRERAWNVAQEIAAASPAAFNAALLGDLNAGQDSVVLATQGGPDALTIGSLADLKAALAKVDLTALTVHLDAGADATPLAALYLTLAQQRKADWGRLAGSVTADPLGEWVRGEQLRDSVDGLCDALAGWTNWAANHAPNLHTIGVNGRLWADAGANAVQELAFVLAAATEYINALGRRDVPPEVVAAKMRFQFAAGPQFFTEIAKLRAWRPLWTRVVSAFGVGSPVATRSVVHVATCRWNKTLLDPHVNMLRVTTEALSAVLGGCDSLHIAPFDEVTGVTNDFSRRIARNVHTLLAEEFGFMHAADPSGGSWYVEKLTDELARKAWELFQQIQSRGGYAAALREGFPQQLVAGAAEEKAEAVGKRRLGLVGTNLFPNLKEKSLSGLPAGRATPAPSRGGAVPTLQANARWPERFEAALSAAKAGASVSELAAFGTPARRTEASIATVQPWRASAGFEQLRAASDAHLKKTGQRPRVFLAKMGPALQHKARADFSAGFFATAGFEIVGKQSFDTAQAAAEAAAASGAPVAVLCSTDETYPELAPAFARTAKTARPGLNVVLAGLPAEAATIDAFRAAGVDEFIHVRANVQAVLAKFLKQIGVLA